MLQPTQIFTSRAFGALFFHAGTLGCMVCLEPQLFLPIYPLTNVGWPSPLAAALPTRSSSHCLAAHPLCPSCLSPPLLSVWINVSSLSPWLMDFSTVQFSGSSGYFLFLYLLLSFFCLREGTKCIYPLFHIGQKSLLQDISNMTNLLSFCLFRNVIIFPHF